MDIVVPQGITTLIPYLFIYLFIKRYFGIRGKIFQICGFQKFGIFFIFQQFLFSNLHFLKRRLPDFSFFFFVSPQLRKFAPKKNTINWYQYNILKDFQLDIEKYFNIFYINQDVNHFSSILIDNIRVLYFSLHSFILVCFSSPLQTPKCLSFLFADCMALLRRNPFQLGSRVLHATF